jgi:tRNA threonylcarbamoyladenosine biosynthesis protein TsaE
MKLYLPDEAATVALAKRLHAVLPTDTAGWIVLLEGELGAGKSTFARALIVAMGHRGSVPSPTYTLVEPYLLPNRTVYHVDLYRIAAEEELRYLGWTELENGFRLVEWPDRAPRLTKAADLKIRLGYAKRTGRNAEISGLSPRGDDLVSRLSAGPNTQLMD